MRKLSFLLLLAFATAGHAQPKRAKNVILLLADAAGVATVSAASLHGYGAPQKLYIQSWPHIALSDTSTASNWVSDSAAGMSAIMTGRKTLNGVISQAPDAVRGKQDGTPLKTLLEHAEERGLSTGVLTDVSVADATPAACYAHANDRRKWGEIFLQVFSPRFGDGVDFLAGMGRKAISEQIKALGKDLDSEAQAHKRPVLASLSEIPEGARRAITVADSGFDLNQAAKMAIATLSKNPKGYFLVIESDAHTDNPLSGLDRLVKFDKLIRELAGTVDRKNTLMIFTADHSFDFRVRGGANGDALLKDAGNQRAASGESLKLQFIRVDNTHTAEEVIAAAQGPGAERVKGFFPNTEIFKIVMAALGWKE